MVAIVKTVGEMLGKLFEYNIILNCELILYYLIVFRTGCFLLFPKRKRKKRRKEGRTNPAKAAVQENRILLLQVRKQRKKEVIVR